MKPNVTIHQNNIFKEMNIIGNVSVNLTYCYVSA